MVAIRHMYFNQISFVLWRAVTFEKVVKQTKLTATAFQKIVVPPLLKIKLYCLHDNRS